jgi:hypothetical protein
MTKLEPGSLKEKVEDWYQIQYQMAHHDIWWPKGQQITAATSTFLLFGALVGAVKLFWPNHPGNPQATPPQLGITRFGVTALTILSMGVALFGILYAWNLWWTMVRARQRAKDIAELVDDTNGVMRGALASPYRDWEFPVVASVLHLTALVVVLAYIWQ